MGNILFIICHTFFRTVPYPLQRYFVMIAIILPYITEQTNNMEFGLWNAPTHKKRKDLHVIWSTSNFPWHSKWLKSNEANTHQFFKTLKSYKHKILEWGHTNRILELGENWAPLSQHFSNLGPTRPPALEWKAACQEGREPGLHSRLTE